MNLNFSKMVVVSGITSILLAIVSYLIKYPLLGYITIFSFSLTSLIIGFDAIISKKLIMPSKYNRRMNETYLGTAAIAQGITSIILAGFLFYANYLDITDTGHNIFKSIIKRPGTVLIIVGIYILSYSVIAFNGYQEQKNATKFVYYLDLFSSRILPGIILLFLGSGFTILGIIEIIAPQYFDSLGGGFLELLFDVK